VKTRGVKKIIAQPPLSPIPLTLNSGGDSSSVSSLSDDDDDKSDRGCTRLVDEAAAFAGENCISVCGGGSGELAMLVSVKVLSGLDVWLLTLVVVVAVVAETK